MGVFVAANGKGRGSIGAHGQLRVPYHPDWQPGAVPMLAKHLLLLMVLSGVVRHCVCAGASCSILQSDAE
jgi:hypothetical protein